MIKHQLSETITNGFSCSTKCERQSFSGQYLKICRNFRGLFFHFENPFSPRKVMKVTLNLFPLLLCCSFFSSWALSSHRPVPDSLFLVWNNIFPVCLPYAYFKCNTLRKTGSILFGLSSFGCAELHLRMLCSRGHIGFPSRQTQAYKTFCGT